MSKAKNQKAKKAKRLKKPGPFERAAYIIARRGVSGKPVRPSQTQRERDARAVAIEARCRTLGITKDQAGLQEASSPVGLCLLARLIDKRMADAAADYCATDSDWRTLKGMPRQTLPAVLWERSGGRNDRPLSKDAEEVLSDLGDKLQRLRGLLLATIGPRGLDMFDDQVLRDVYLTDPVATLALANGLSAIVKYWDDLAKAKKQKAAA